MKTIVLFALTLMLCNTASAQITAGFTANKWNICINDSLLVTDTSTTATGTITSWVWDFGDGSALFVGQQPPYHHYTVDDTVYTITLTVINSANDTAVVTHTVTVNPTPKPIVQATPSPACAYTNINFSNIGTNVDSSFIYIWNTSTTGSVFNQNFNYVPQNSGTDSMCLTVQTIKGCKGSTCTPFTVYPKIEPYFTNAVCANLTMCFNDSSNATNVTKWFWAFGDGDTSTLQNPTHTYTSAGSYNVSLVTESSYGCSEYYSKTVNIPNTLGLNSILNSTIQGISIINNTLYINTTQPLHYALYNVSGQVMAQGNAAPQQGVIHLNTALTNGIYFIQLTQGEQRVTKKIVVQE
ncbi:MAG: PKD domain-containing protein [Bacteroidia bacterium]